jgi:hypothetical protein
LNIFVLDSDIKLCAAYHADKHVVKMIVEYAQLLCSAHYAHPTAYKVPYKKTHYSHPCSIWTRTSIENYRWLVNLGECLCDEYFSRYGRSHKVPREHGSKSIIKWAKYNEPNIPSAGITPFPLAMPEYCKIKDNAVESYRRFYVFEKPFVSWKNGTPLWFKDMKNGY